jgi:tRNA (cytidine/uridine-2'-O-)-methyltransferase
MSNVTDLDPLLLPPHRLRVALMQPEIAPNTGNVGRLCVATGTELHLVRPLGFVPSDRALKRSGMDYWKRLRLTVHDDDDAFLASIGAARVWLFTSKAERSLWDCDFADGDVLAFGNETKGLSERVRGRFPERGVRIPQAAGERCLNLSTAVGIGLYEALRRVRAARA